MAKATLSQVKLQTKDKCTSGKQYGTLQTNGIKVSKSQIDETEAAVTGYSGMTMITMYIRWRVGFARSAPTNNMPVPRKLNQRRTHWRVTLPNCCAIVRRTPAGSRVTSLKNNAQLLHATSTNKWGCYACKSKLHVGTKQTTSAAHIWRYLYLDPRLSIPSKKTVQMLDRVPCPKTTISQLVMLMFPLLKTSHL